MRLVLFGYSSFVGRAVISYYEENTDTELVRIGRNGGGDNVIKFEVSDSEKVLKAEIDKILNLVAPDRDTIILNLISLGSPDYCELNPAASWQTNHNLPVTLYDALAEREFGKFIQFSSNGVYAGDNPPYSETSYCAPVNIYGRHKLAADEYLLKQNDTRILIVRPTTMYGVKPEGGRDNPVGMIIQNILSGKSVKLVNDLKVNLLFVGDLCEYLDRLIKKDASGLFNIAGNQILSRYDIGVVVASVLSCDTSLMTPCSMADFQAVAKRPLDTTFSTSLLKKVTGFEATSLEKVLELHDYRKF